MLQNYLKVALRTLRKHKLYAFINIAGLAVGIACCLLIALFVRDELSYDRFHENADHLYRAWVHEDYGEGQQFTNTSTPIVLGPTLEATFPEVEQVVRVAAFTELAGREQPALSQLIHLADPGFFDVFSFRLLRGDPAEVLRDPGRVVLTETAAERYFGTEDPVGQTLRVRIGEQDVDFRVSGLMQDPPSASSIQPEILMPFARSRDRYSENAHRSWTNVATETYVLLRAGVPGAALEAKLPVMMRQALGDRYQEGTYRVALQPITDIHLNPDLPAGLVPPSDPRYAYILSAIALLVLLIACINFMTLSIGHSAGRAREVGLRKVLGAPRQQLMRQFWGEAFLLTGFAVAVALLLAHLLLPLFNGLAGRTLTLSLDAGLLLFLAAMILVVGLAAGSYPALVLSGFRPIEALRDRLQISGDRSLFRRGLVVVQFALSIVMIISTLVMAQQLRYLQTKHLGFDKEQVVVIPTGVDPAEALTILERFRNNLGNHNAVTSIAAAAFTFAEGWAEVGFTADDGTYRELNMNWVTHGFVETLGLEMKAGRSFSPAFPTDSSALLVNEALVQAYGWDDPIGKRLPGPRFPDHEIIGVVGNFHYASLHTPVEPLVIALNPNVVLEGIENVEVRASPRRKLFVRIQPENVPATVALLRQTWEHVAPGRPFDYTFLDAALDSQYRQEERLGQIVSAAAALSILIACLGLFGLAALAALRRTKEIGIRKVLGASAAGIALLLSKDFLGLVLIAFAVALPVAYVAMHRWLEDFAYRTEIGPGLFLLAGLAALLIALLTVSYQALKAALVDPVQSLRYE